MGPCKFAFSTGICEAGKTKHLSTYMMTIWNIVCHPRQAEKTVNTGAITMTKQGLTFGPAYRSNVLETF